MSHHINYTECATIEDDSGYSKSVLKYSHTKSLYFGRPTNVKVKMIVLV